MPVICTYNMIFITGTFISGKVMFVIMLLKRVLSLKWESYIPGKMALILKWSPASSQKPSSIGIPIIKITQSRDHKRWSLHWSKAMISVAGDTPWAWRSKVSSYQYMNYYYEDKIFIMAVPIPGKMISLLRQQSQSPGLSCNCLRWQPWSLRSKVSMELLWVIGMGQWSVLSLGLVPLQCRNTQYGVNRVSQLL